MMKLRFLLPLLAAAFSGGASAATDYPTGYAKCVQVGATCNLSGTANVAFGKSGVFTYASLTGPFVCSAALFPANTYSANASSWCSLPTGSATSSASSSSVASSVTSSVSSSVTSTSSSSAASATGGGQSSSWAGSSATATDARAQTGASTPLPDARYGTRTYSAPVLVDGKHSPSNYRAAPALPVWQFATVDPTAGKLSFERATAPASGWHTWSRKGKVIVTGGAAAATNRVYTVFNGQQLVAALKEAGNEPKIIRVIGHIDLRWSANNTVFKEYTSYEDQKYGGSISIPSNTTLVGVNDAQGRAARITGTTVLIGQEWSTTGAILSAACGTTKASVDPEADYKAWIGCGKDPEDYPTWTRNIIIRNLQIEAPWDVNPEDSANAYADAMTVSRAQNIYIDHVSMSDGDTPDSMASDTRHDGLLDVVRGADYVTITNSYFNKHHKTTLIGNGDSGRAWSDEGRLHVTLSNNFWDRMGSRLPLNRFGQVHMYNNYIYGRTDSAAPDDLKFDGGPDPRYHSNMILENMYFEITALSTDSWCGKAILDGKDPIGFRSAGHLLLSDKGGNTVAQGWDGQCGRAAPSGADVWYPPYGYATKATVDVPAYVRANSGAGKIK
jgi:pectate lyase